MITATGLVWLQELLGERLADARLVVGDGDQPAHPNDPPRLAGANTASTPVEKVTPVEVEENGEVRHRLILEGTFGEDQANFDWSEHGVVLNDKLIDRVVEDGGRKVLGAVWKLEASIDLIPVPTPN